MLWLFEVNTSIVITILKQELGSTIAYEHNFLMTGLSLIGIDVTWLLSVVCLLMRIMTCFLRYSGYLNFIKCHIMHVLLLTFKIGTIKNHVIK